MKNFVVEDLGYLLSPFFGENDELLGIKIIYLSFFLFFSLFIKDLLPHTLDTMNLEKM